MIRCVVFDFDGTLVDSNAIKRRTFYEVTADIPGAAKELDRILADPSVGDRYDIFRALAERLASVGGKSDALAQAYGRVCEMRILDLLRSSSVTETLDRLRSRGLTLFINSATPEADLVALVAKTPFAERFAGVYGRPRSKTEILRRIMADHHSTPDEIVVVGDGEDDRQSAAETGCRFVGVGQDAAAFGGPVDTLVASVETLARTEILATIESPGEARSRLAQMGGRQRMRSVDAESSSSGAGRGGRAGPRRRGLGP